MTLQSRGYDLIEKIGSGGFGEVYHAVQHSINRDVAIKVILPQFADQDVFLTRFRTEAQLIGRIEHPHTVPLYDYWHDDTGAYLVMRWMRGGSLADILNQQSSLTHQQVLKWMEQVAQALQNAHEYGIIHRDLKPDNILLDEQNNAYLADFGIAKDISISSDVQTLSPFSPHYAAPEQFGGGTFTTATDIYAFGIVIYTLLHGQPPYNGTLSELVQAHLHTPLPTLRDNYSTIPSAVDVVLERATAKNPEDRYQDALDLLSDLQSAFIGETVSTVSKSVHVDNPFFHRGAIRDSKFFFGRDNELRQLLNLINTGQSISIIGQRRIGKTSLLYRVLNAANLTNNGISLQDNVLIYVDCGSLITLEQHELYRFLLEEIEDAIYDKNLTDFQFSALQYDKTLTYRHFERALRDFFRKGWKLVLALDEFELLSRNGHLGSDFFTGLRALAMRYQLTYITASKQPLLDLTYADESTLSSPFFNIFATIQLARFSDDDARTMLTTLSQMAGQILPDNIIDHILLLAGGMPLFLQIGAYHASEQLFQHGVIDMKVLENQLESKFAKHIEYYWRSLTVEEQRLMLTLPLATDRDRDSLQHLAKQALLVDDGGDYRHVSPLLTDFISKQTVPNIVHAGAVIIDTSRHMVIVHGDVVELTPLQYTLLILFITQADEALTTETMEQALWEDDYIDDPERLKSVIKGLRRVLGDYADHIENVRGVGYRWRTVL